MRRFIFVFFGAVFALLSFSHSYFRRAHSSTDTNLEIGRRCTGETEVLVQGRRVLDELFALLRHVDGGEHASAGTAAFLAQGLCLTMKGMKRSQRWRPPSRP